MKITWPASTISSILKHHFPTPPTVIITFDKGGISSHPNHISLLAGARHYISETANETGLYTLTSVSIFRKYISVLDGPLTLWKGGKLVFVSTLEGLRTAQKAMTDAHVSQMRWFRWGWIGLSRYMVVNDLVEERI